MDIYLVLYLIVIVAPIGTILHEVGHALGAKLVKADKITLTIGIGKRIGTISIQHLTVSIHSVFFLGGYVKNKRKQAYKRWELIVITIGGPIVNLIFCVLFYLLYSVTMSSYIKLLFLFNLWLAVVNLIPFKLGNRQSDGYSVCQIIRKYKHIT